MADTDLRDAERGALRRPDDVAVGHAWLAEADRAADPGQATRALGHLARLGDRRGYDALCMRAPWPHEDGPGCTRFLRADALAAVVLESSGPVSDDLQRPGAGGPRDWVKTHDGRELWPVTGALWFTPDLAVTLERDGTLVTRDPTTGRERARLAAATGPLSTSSSPLFLAERTLAARLASIEADRALLVDPRGGARCVDLHDLGRTHWDSRGERTAGTVRAYDPGAAYLVGDRVTHAKFGEGVVRRVIDGRKVAVAFADGERTLAHGSRGAAGSRPPLLLQPFQRVLLAASVAFLQDGARVTALDAGTGALLWATEHAAELCAADERGVVLAARDPRGRTAALAELEARTGRELWSFPFSGVALSALGADIALATHARRTGGRVNRAVEGELVALERATGEVRWRGRQAHAPHAITRTRGLLWHKALDLATGEVRRL